MTHERYPSYRIVYAETAPPESYKDVRDAWRRAKAAASLADQIKAGGASLKSDLLRLIFGGPVVFVDVRGFIPNYVDLKRASPGVGFSEQVVRFSRYTNVGGSRHVEWCIDPNTSMPLEINAALYHARYSDPTGDFGKGVNVTIIPELNDDGSRLKGIIRLMEE